MKKKCKYGFVRTGNKCSKASIRVFYESPTNSGYQKSDIKIFPNKPKARSYALNLVKKLKKSAKETDDDEMVIVENIETGETVESWINELGKVEHYPGGR